MDIQLRDYQKNGANDLYTKLKTNDSVLFQLATGGGKTFIFSFFIKYWIGANDKNVLILVHRAELVQQTVKSLNKLGVDVEVIDADNKKPKHNCRVYVAMVQTLSRRLKKDNDYLPNVGLIVVDECHRNDFNNIFEYYKSCKRVGFSATPISAVKKNPLKNMYQDIVCCAGINDLIKEGNLTDNKTYTIVGVEKHKLKKDNKGEYSQSSMMGQFNLPKMVENTIIAYENKCKGGKTLIFNVGCEHSINVCNAFIEKGYECKYLDGNSKDREEILTWFKNTDDAILCNIDILTTGFDEPSVKNIIVNRSTTSLPLWLQMTGRGGRLYPGKEYFTIIDLGGNVANHGDWKSPRDWNKLFFQNVKQGEGVAPIKGCPECGFINYLSSKCCTDCGVLFEKNEKVENKVFKLALLGTNYHDLFQYNDVFNNMLKRYNILIDCFDVVEEYKYKKDLGHNHYSTFHLIYDTIIKSMWGVKAKFFLENKKDVIEFIKIEFQKQYTKLHNFDNETFKTKTMNKKYWEEQVFEKINNRYKTNF